jgi:hypothetical protein
MKTYAPQGLHGVDLRGLLADLECTPAQAAKYLKVTERSVWRWLSDGSAPFAALAALWLESPHGRHVAALDVGNELVIVRGLQRSTQDQATQAAQQLCRVLAISTTGAANDPLISGPLQLGGVLPLRLNPVSQGRQLPDDHGGDDGAAQHNQALPDHGRRRR